MSHCVFEYLYRDAGNFKAWGGLLLEGELAEVDIELLRRKFESEEFFIAEQIGVPTLYEKLWRECECESSDELDHVWHEYAGIREATEEDIGRLKPWTNVKLFLANVAEVQEWRLELSRNFPL